MRAPDGAGSRSRRSAGQGRVCLGHGRPALQAEGTRQAKARGRQKARGRRGRRKACGRWRIKPETINVRRQRKIKGKRIMPAQAAGQQARAHGREGIGTHRRARVSGHYPGAGC